MRAVILEVIAVGVIHGLWRGVLVRDYPLPVRAVDEQAVQLRHDFRLLDQQFVNTRDVDVLQPVAFDPLPKCGSQYIHLPNGILGVLRRGSRQVGHGVAG
ncbi:hypothetical protein D3C84_1011100 [compost metagenome]